MSDSYNPVDYNLSGSSVHGILQHGESEVGCCFLLQGIFLTQGSNPGLWHCRQTLPSEPERGYLYIIQDDSAMSSCLFQVLWISHRPQWNGIIDLRPTVIRGGGQNPHDEVQMVSQRGWLKGMPCGHVGQSLGLWSALTLKLLCMWPSPCKGFYSCCIFQINYSVLQTTPCLHLNCNSFYPVHVTLSNWLYHLASLSAPTR